jgi:uncharacterized membrane protein YhhN
MQTFLAPVPLVALGAWLTWRARQRGDWGRVAVYQPATTVLVLLVAALGLATPGAEPGYTGWIIAGLALSLVGDFVNINMGRDDVLRTGLLIFLVAYLLYPVGITVYDGFHPQDVYGAAALLGVYGLVVALFWTRLDSGWRLPVLVYALILLGLVWRCVATFFGDFFTPQQAALLTSGACMLFIGDLEYGLHRFRQPFERLWGPLLYPAGQLAIALTPGMFPAGGG